MIVWKLAPFCRPPEIRLAHATTGRLLHMSGRGEASAEAYAWIGTRAQARELRRRALSAGEPWPWRAIRADATGLETAMEGAE